MRCSSPVASLLFVSSLFQLTSVSARKTPEEILAAPRRKPPRPAKSIADVIQGYAVDEVGVCSLCSPLVHHSNLIQDPCTCIVKPGLAYEPEGYDPGRKWSDPPESRLFAYQCIPSRYLLSDWRKQISTAKCGCIYDNAFNAKYCVKGEANLRWDDAPTINGKDLNSSNPKKVRAYSKLVKKEQEKEEKEARKGIEG